MHVQMGAPEEGTYRFVLTRFDWNPRQEYLEQNYGEVRRTRCVQWPSGLPLPKRRPDMDRWRPAGPEDNPPGGEFVCMLFCNDPHFRTRMLKMGYLEITDAWIRHHQGDTITVTVDPVPGGLRAAVSPVYAPIAGAARRPGPLGAGASA